ncbi:MAG: Ferric transporter ATP-binding subunit [Dehalococcoidia bacterium]|nr:Ferric transporter ATP-binding subunit [Dehalococcoidia bacterium]
MKRLFTPGLIGLAILGLLLASCSPGSAPTPVPAAPTPAKTTVPASNLPPPTSQDAAWAKVIDAAKQEGSLTIYSITLTGDIGIATAKAFKDRTGITLDVISGRGAAFIERIKTETRIGQMVGDILESSVQLDFTLKATDGTVSTLDIPVLREKGVWRVEPLSTDAEGHILNHKSYYLSPWVNTNLIKSGQEPKSYRDLAKPEWKGKILMSDPSVSGSGYDVLVTMVNRGYLDNDYVKSLGGQGIKFASGTLDVVRALAKGDEAFGFAATDSDAASFLAEGAPIKAIAMEEGTLATPSAMARVKNGPHPNASKVFLNWILGAEGQTVFSKGARLASVRSDVQDFRHPAAVVEPKRLIVYTGQDTEKVAKAFQDKWLVELWKKK